MKLFIKLNEFFKKIIEALVKMFKQKIVRSNEIYLEIIFRIQNLIIHGNLKHQLLIAFNI